VGTEAEEDEEEEVGFGVQPEEVGAGAEDGLVRCTETQVEGKKTVGVGAETADQTAELGVAKKWEIGIVEIEEEIEVEHVEAGGMAVEVTEFEVGNIEKREQLENTEGWPWADWKEEWRWCNNVVVAVEMEIELGTWELWERLIDGGEGVDWKDEDGGTEESMSRKNEAEREDDSQDGTENTEGAFFCVFFGSVSFVPV